jgi:hypothetical protein
MKPFRAGAILSISAFCFLLFSPLKIHADGLTPGLYVSLELTGTGSLAIGRDAAYPYYMSIDGASSSTWMMCVSFDNDISPGESWAAQVQAITGTKVEEAAWLFNDDNVSIAAGNYTEANDDQWAAWEIFSTNAQNATPPDAGAAVQLAAAEYAVAMGTEPTAFYKQFVIIIPEWGWPGGDDVPQNFLAYGDSPIGPDAPAPEPNSLILLGSGLAGLATALYRKRHSAPKVPPANA